MRLQNKRILITGSSSGVGLALAKRFVSEGARVAVHSHLPYQQCPELKQGELAPCKFFQQDLTQLDALPSFIEQVWSTLGGIDVLINNAGMYSEPHFLELTSENLQRVMQLNFYAPVLLTQAWAKLCIKHGIKGKALCTSSVNARLSEPCHVSYDASKAALEGFVRAASIDLACSGITLNAIALGLVYTPLTAPGIDAKGVRQMLNQVILLGVTNTVAVTGMYVHLASDDSGDTTGGVFPVDGGLSGTQATIITSGSKLLCTEEAPTS